MSRAGTTLAGPAQNSMASIIGIVEEPYDGQINRKSSVTFHDE